MAAGEIFGIAEYRTDESEFIASLNSRRHQGMQKRRAEKTELRKVKKEARERTKKERHENRLREAITGIFLRETKKKFGVSTVQIAALADDELSLLDAWLIQRLRRQRMASVIVCAAIPIFGWLIGLINLLCRSDQSSRKTGHYVFYRKKLDRSRKAQSFPFWEIHQFARGQEVRDAQEQDITKTASGDSHISPTPTTGGCGAHSHGTA